MLKAGVIGCGFIAGAYEDPVSPGIGTHAKAYRRDGRFGELGFCDTHGERASALAGKFGGRAYPDAAALLRELKPDVVSVCVPDDRHFAVLEEALTCATPPRVVFAEKPVCGSREELKELERLERESGAVIVVNHTRRFDPAHRKLRELVRGGSLGGLVRGHVDYYGGFRHLGVHVVDLLRFLFGADVEAEDLRYCCSSKYADDPTLDGTLRVAGAPVALFGMDEARYQILDIALLFERGQLKLSDFGQRIEVLRKTVNAARESVLETDPAFSGTGLTAPLAEAVRLIADFLESKKPDPSALADFGLAEAGKTMESLWRGCENYACRS